MSEQIIREISEVDVRIEGVRRELEELLAKRRALVTRLDQPSEPATIPAELRAYVSIELDSATEGLIERKGLLLRMTIGLQADGSIDPEDHHQVHLHRTRDRWDFALCGLDDSTEDRWRTHLNVPSGRVCAICVIAAREI